MRRLLQKVGLGNSEPRVVPSCGRMTYSQCGEDVIVDYIFGLKKITAPSYLDLGAHDPWYLNNTALFYQRGCRGINVEPNPELHRRFEQSRPGDVNLNVGTGGKAGRLPLFIMEDPTLSTFSPDDVGQLAAHGHQVAESRAIEVSTISDVVDRHAAGRFPDFLSMDVEGMEEEILQGIDYRSNAPKVICLETAEYSPSGRGAKRRSLMQFVLERGFEVYADTNLNTIFVRSDFWRSDQ